MIATLKQVLDRLETWPEADQEELADYARHIESRRSKGYEARPEELQVLDEAERSGTATEGDVERAFRSFRGA
jgi:hypothetical protein